MSAVADFFVESVASSSWHRVSETILRSSGSASSSLNVATSAGTSSLCFAISSLMAASGACSWTALEVGAGQQGGETVGAGQDGTLYAGMLPGRRNEGEGLESGSVAGGAGMAGGVDT